MKLVDRFRLVPAALIVTSALLISTTPILAQGYPPPPSFTTEQLDSLVSRIALYPDPLLAQILAAASFPDQIPNAARWADQNRNLRGDDLANAMYQANLPFDPAVQALIPFPTVLDMMAADPNWTATLGTAVLANRSAVMDAVQAMRHDAEQYGYLQSNQQIRVTDNGGYIEIDPVDAGFICVPAYDPFVVFAPPAPGFFVGGAIGFGDGFYIGGFSGWGWGGGFNWYNHTVIVNHVAWGRTWNNRETYIHNYGNRDRGQWRNNTVEHRAEVVNTTRNVTRPTQPFAGNYRPQPTQPAPARSFERPAPAPAVHAEPARTFERPAPAPARQSFTASRGGAPVHMAQSRGGRR